MAPASAAVLVNAASDLAALAVDAALLRPGPVGLGAGQAGRSLQRGPLAGWPCRLRRPPEMPIDCAGNGGSAGAESTNSTPAARPRRARNGSTANWRNVSWSASPAPPDDVSRRVDADGGQPACVQASFAAIDEAPRSTRPSAPAAL